MFLKSIFQNCFQKPFFQTIWNSWKLVQEKKKKKQIFENLF